MNQNDKFIIYIDESGILSKNGRSVYICLYVESLYEINLSQNVLKIEKDFKIAYSHWVDMSWKIRVKFAEKIKRLDYICKVVIYNNPIDQKNILKDFMIKVFRFEDRVSKIIIDGSQGKKYERKLKLFLKKEWYKSL
ncbi:hypothetical protein H7Y21_00835 [Arenimonas sp.]|nr:hypothetical protein [Candidatus Parcubacteria bacterium]